MSFLTPLPPLQNPGYASGDCTHCMPFFDLKVFLYVKTAKIRWLGATPPDPRLFPPFGQILGTPMHLGAAEPLATPLIDL